MQNFKLSKLFSSGYRVVLFDLASLLFNLVVLALLVPGFASLAGQSEAASPLAIGTVASFCLAAAFLQPLGAVLKYTRAHQRNPDLQTTTQTFLKRAGCLPIFLYFALQLMFLIFAAALLADLRFGSSFPPGLFAVLFFGLPLLAGLNTLFVWLYFSAPAKMPTLPFMQSPLAEWVGDGCIFFNLIFYQVWWWYLLADPYFSTRSTSLGGTFEKILAFAGMFLFFYIPPRIFNLAEALDLRWTGIGMLLANLPILIRMFFGIR